MKALLSHASLVLFLAAFPFRFAQAQWVPTNGPYLPDGMTKAPVLSLCTSSGNLFAGAESYGGVFRSPDSGASWASVSFKVDVNALVSTGTSLFAGTSGGIFVSTNNGVNWTDINSGLNQYEGHALSLIIDGSTLYAGTWGGVIRSTNNGATWIRAVTHTPINTNALATSGSNLFAGNGTAVHLSTDSGATWTDAKDGITNGNVYALAVVGTSLYAGTLGGGVFLSTNNGTNWNAVNTGLVDSNVRALAVSGSNLFAGTYGHGVYLTTDGGINWNAANTGLSNMSIISLLIAGTTLFAGTDSGVWRRPLSEMVASVQQSNDQLPHGYTLLQNYPNPFNPTTTIGYALPQRSEVILSVFNLLGQPVATLVSGQIQAGYHEVTFDASCLASGVYFYRLRAGTYTQTKRLLLLR